MRACVRLCDFLSTPSARLQQQISKFHFSFRITWESRFIWSCAQSISWPHRLNLVCRFCVWILYDIVCIVREIAKRRSTARFIGYIRCGPVCAVFRQQRRNNNNNWPKLTRPGFLWSNATQFSTFFSLVPSPCAKFQPNFRSCFSTRSVNFLPTFSVNLQSTFSQRSATFKSVNFQLTFSQLSANFQPTFSQLSANFQTLSS